jgi:hypothetical protein
MIRIFCDKEGSGEYVIQTTALDTETFVAELAEAMHTAVRNQDDGGLAVMGILKNAMPIAYKLSGYKADSVSEQRTLVCGTVSPGSCEVVASAGR